jgi:hypothetical protein
MRKLLLFVSLAQAQVLADGGAVQWRAEAGHFVVAVFTSPAPLTVGPVDISLLLQNRQGLEPVLDASVLLLLRAQSDGAEIRTLATRDQAQNKLLYAGQAMLTEPGTWRIAASILRDGERTETAGTIEVAARREMLASYWGYVAFPPLTIIAFAIREWLMRRKVSPCAIT